MSNTNTQMQNPEHEQAGTTELYNALTHNGGKPVYISDINNDAKINLCSRQGAAAVFDLDTINRELNTEVKRANISDFFAHPFKPEGIKKASPIIILFNEKDPRTKAKAGNVFKILSNTGLSVFKQSSNRPYKAITCAGAESTRAQLVEQYRNNFSVGGNIGEFDNIIESNANTPAIKTGFAQLDQILDGGLYEGLYAIGAISSLGKTAFCLSIADNIAAQGHDVIIISMEMSKFEFIGRSISRLTFLCTQNPKSPYKYEYAKTERGITDGTRYKNYTPKEIELIDKCKKIYAEKVGKNLFIYESIGGMTTESIDALIHEHIGATGNKPIVIIDYLQCLQHADPRINSNDKMKTDANLWALKRISRDYKLPIIAISSFNRESYTRKPTFSSFKESGAIEYTCSVIMSMYYKGIGGDIDEAEAKAKNPREIVIEILKNRQGRTGDKINYFYFPMFNYFVEDTNGNEPPKMNAINWSIPMPTEEPEEIEEFEI